MAGYTDYSFVCKDDKDLVQAISGDGEQQSAWSNFPFQLHYILREVEVEGKDDVISWLPHGRAFKVHNKERFVKEILPTWFRQHKFTSFQRQLNLYGFIRISNGPDKGSYYHEMFLRTKRFLCRRIKRKRIKGNGTKKAHDPVIEVNFYELPFLPLDNDQQSSDKDLKKQVRRGVSPDPSFGVGGALHTVPHHSVSTEPQAQALTGAAISSSSKDRVPPLPVASLQPSCTPTPSMLAMALQSGLTQADLDNANNLLRENIEAAAAQSRSLLAQQLWAITNSGFTPPQEIAPVTHSINSVAAIAGRSFECVLPPPLISQQPQQPDQARIASALLGALYSRIMDAKNRSNEEWRQDFSM